MDRGWVISGGLDRILHRFHKHRFECGAGDCAVSDCDDWQAQQRRRFYGAVRNVF